MLPIAVAHGEGRAEFASDAAAASCAASGLVGVRYVNARPQRCATTYPANPNGSPFGIAALCNADGRVTIIMPHPERSFRYVQNSWHPRDAGEYSGWMRLFRNARALRRLNGARSARGQLKGVTLLPVSSRKKRRTMIACCSLPLRT